MSRRTRQTGEGPDAAVLLRVSEHFLRGRHFDDCQKYAHQALQSDPNLPGVNEILAVADVLLAFERRISLVDLPDWYAVLQLSRYSSDSNLIRRRFNHLSVVLNPSNNKFPYADEAFDLVREAWYVLSNPLKKCEYDDVLKKHFNGGKLNKCGFAFWTVCPYCYYLYEYPRVYLECCLKCSNENCTKAFTCVEIDRPPVEVLREGKYLCAGFLPVGFPECGWNPFSPLKKEKEKENVSNYRDNFVDISVDDCETESDNSCNAGGEGVDAGKESAKMEADKQCLKVDTKRKKSLAKSTKKVMGTGSRVMKHGFVPSDGEETELDVDWSDDNDEFGDGFVGGNVDGKDGEVEFYDGDDDILVSLQNEI